MLTKLVRGPGGLIDCAAGDLARQVAVTFFTDAAAESVRVVAALARGGRSRGTIAGGAYHAAELAAVGAALRRHHLLELKHLLRSQCGLRGAAGGEAAVLHGAGNDGLGLGVGVRDGASVEAGGVGSGAVLRTFGPLLARLKTFN